MGLFTKKTFEEKLEEKLETWGDEEVLFNFGQFLDRVGINTRFIQDEDVITGEVIIISCGDKMMLSSPKEFLQPLTYVENTTEEKAKAN